MSNHLVKDNHVLIIVQNKKNHHIKLNLCKEDLMLGNNQVTAIGALIIANSNWEWLK